MGTILAILKRIEALNADEIVTETMQESAPAMEEKNREQLYEGEKADNTEITPSYTPYTVAVKQMKGQPTDRVTLRDTGSFYQGLYVTIQGDKVVTDSLDSKTQKLEDKYGTAIFGLNDKYGFEVMQETIRPTFRAKMETATGLKMK